jgi:hypothetical protein
MDKRNIMLLLAAMSFSLAFGQHVTAEQQVQDCGQVIYRHPVKADFELTNTDPTTLLIQNVRVSCGCTAVDYPKTPIAKGSKFVIRVTYDAQQMGHFDKQVGIYYANQESPTFLTLRGVVVEEIVNFSGEYPFSIGNFKLDKNDLEFDDVNRGDRPVQKIHIKNVGMETLQPQILHLPDYLSARISPSRIAPGHSGEVTLTLDSKMIRNFGLTQTGIYLGESAGDKVSADKEITVSTVLLPDFDKLTNLQKTYAPKLELSTSQLDLGYFGTKSKLKGIVELKNTGLALLDIRSLQMFTSGLEMSLGKTRLMPGETTKLKVTAIARDLKKARSKPRVLMITNDPEHPKVVIQINAK